MIVSRSEFECVAVIHNVRVFDESLVVPEVPFVEKDRLSILDVDR